MKKTDAIAILQNDLKDSCAAKEFWERFGEEMLAAFSEMKIEAYKMAIYALGGATV